MLKLKTATVTQEVFDTDGTLLQKTNLCSREISLEIPLIGTMALLV